MQPFHWGFVIMAPVEEPERFTFISGKTSHRILSILIFCHKFTKIFKLITAVNLRPRHPPICSVWTLEFF